MAFYEIAVPHKDILSMNFSSEVYAAKLWDVYNGVGPDEYVDQALFFEKTYFTANLKTILESVENRLNGKGGGHFRSISTPFGGGKTHTLIALYHKCAEWDAKPVVLVGHALDPKTQTLWGIIEEQITGKIEHLAGKTPRGTDALKAVLKNSGKPILILIDELLQYITRAAAADRENNTDLATMTIAFIQELGEVVSSLNNVCVVVTLPSSTTEHLNNEAYMQLYNQLRKVAHRTMDTITPVSNTDIPKIIRQRLFSTPPEEIRQKAKGVVDEYTNYCIREGLIPEGQPTKFREEFLGSYPFLPQVVSVLYERWGTIEQFQRTRGVLRLLSRVVSSLSTSNKQFISLGDFDFNNDNIRQELVEYLDPQFNGVISKDISGSESGASKVNHIVHDESRSKNLGTRVATAIFMYSHSGGAEINGATEAEIKRATCEPGILPAEISDVLNQFRSYLFYLTIANGRYRFTKDTNVLKLKVDVMDNLMQRDIDEREKDMVKSNTRRLRELKPVFYPADTKSIDDSAQLKLVILKSDDQSIIRQLHDSCGESDRIYRNNMFFLVPSSGEKARFMESLKNMMAWEKIRSDPHIKLTKNQKGILTSELKKESERTEVHVKEYYSVLYTPEKDGFVSSRVRPPLVSGVGIDRIVYEHLLDEEAVSHKIGVATLRTRYLRDKKIIETSDLLKSMLSIPGELRPINKNVLENAIIDGVIKGEFGLGEMEIDVPVARYFKKQPSISFEQGEILIHASLCTEEVDPEKHESTTSDDKIESTEDLLKRQDVHKFNSSLTSQKPHSANHTQLKFEFDVPVGQVNHIGQMLLNIASHYKNLTIRIDASEGEMSKQGVEMIRETLRQIGAKYDL